jgi:hypothetical protein
MLKYGLYILDRKANPFDEVLQTEGFLVIPGARIIGVWLEYREVKEVVSTNLMTSSDNPEELENLSEKLDGYLRLGIKRLKSRLKACQELEDGSDLKK